MGVSFNIINFKEKYQILSFCPYDSLYGDDYSLLEFIGVYKQGIH